MVKSCSTCEHRKNDFVFGNECTLSGFLCQTERQIPTKCGVNYENWQPRLGIFERIKCFFFGYKN